MGERCALVVLPRQDGDAARLIRSLETATAAGLGDLAEVIPLDIAAAGQDLDILAEAAEQASAGGFDWLLAVGASEMLSPDIFIKAAPALRLHDAVWGAAGLASDPNIVPKVERITRLAAQDMPGFFHAALRWWIGPTHFVRPGIAAEAAAAATGSAADYMHAIWKAGRAYKTAQALTAFQDEIPPVDEAVRDRLIEILEREPAFMPVRFGERTFRLPYTGLNPVIEREQMRGLFFEQEELEYLAERLPRGLRIVDAGANTGNHTAFFAGIMQAEIVVPIEPLPRSIAAIRATVAENRLSNVDLSRLGSAVGAEEGTMRPIPSVTAGLGATHFAPDPAGEVPLTTLDRLVRNPVDFLKIDVEGMEMQALAGAAGLIAAHHPILYVEVLDTAIAEFMVRLDTNGYRVEKLFPDKTHCNYLLVPADRP